ncbi:transcriptional regulator [Enterobacter sp. Ap-1006]|uniref:winged helix-turn-helix domain-containing protein n=1 Tax=Enterobacter sp. Ap-1006 TaxID=2608345 RepID=UPI00142104A7|nr:transcriptional regulator [Enterobacter sp. Ap-1006]NIF48380.1 transcriptional regulator [Enterobacter sp. Ap-1006]
MNKHYCSVNDWLIDISSGSILNLTTGERKRLGEYQLKLLDTLTKNAGKILTREELTTLVWERRVIGNNSLPNAIHALRTAFEDDGKKQRIIKTIPKKGYLLEQDYCCVIEKEEEEVRDNSDGILLSESTLYAEQPDAEPETAEIVPLQSEPALPQPIVAAEPSRRRWRNISGIALLTVAAILIISSTTWFFFDSGRNRLMYREQESNVYSNINFYEIYPASHDDVDKDQLYTKLKDTLYQMNQLLKGQSIMMNIYYQSVDQTLNYTFSLESSCDRKQLAMAIYHWRIDGNQLNNLILRETRRKIGEMEGCTVG